MDTFLVVIIYLATPLEEYQPLVTPHYIPGSVVRHARRNPQKSQADPVPDSEKTIKEKKVLQKGASGLGKPKKYSISLQEDPAIEQIHVESTDANTSSEEKPSQIHKTPYSLVSPFVVSPKGASPLIHHTPLVSSITPPPSVIQTSSTLLVTTVMAGPQAPTKMERIIAARYGPLILPTPLNVMPTREYQKYMPKFTGTEGVTAEEHLESFYSYADNLELVFFRLKNLIWLPRSLKTCWPDHRGSRPTNLGHVFLMELALKKLLEQV